MKSNDGEKLISVSALSKIAGISIRTIHYYDEIGLLKAIYVSDNGYRMYDESSLRRLQEILLFKELEFSLGDIKEILSNPSYDKDKILEDQIKLLRLKKEHLQGLIEFAENIKEKGNRFMSFKEFDKSKIEEYQKEAKKTWGNTPAFKEYEEKSKNYSYDDVKSIARDFMAIFEEFGKVMDLDPSDERVQSLVTKLKEYITDNYYTCTNEILKGLGKMYAAEGEMKDNIDNASCKGCSEFVSKAIEVYCK